ncbi:Uncharacterised protein [Vibrio cholerae]|nr:Uncharacterised protein [Vibrio cholerae]
MTDSAVVWIEPADAGHVSALFCHMVTPQG